MQILYDQILFCEGFIHVIQHYNYLHQSCSAGWISCLLLLVLPHLQFFRNFFAIKGFNNFVAFRKVINPASRLASFI